jgi:hypothetical protein
MNLFNLLRRKQQKPGIITFLKRLTVDIGDFLKTAESLLSSKLRLKDRYEKLKEKSSLFYKIIKSILKGEVDGKYIITEGMKKLGKRALGKLGKIKDWFVKKSEIDDEDNIKGSLKDKIINFFKNKKKKNKSAIDSEETEQDTDTEDIKQKAKKKNSPIHRLKEAMAKQFQREQKRKQEVEEEKELTSGNNKKGSKGFSIGSIVAAIGKLGGTIVGALTSLGKFVVGGIVKGFVKYVVPSIFKGLTQFLPGVLGEVGGGIIGASARGALSTGGTILRTAALESIPLLASLATNPIGATILTIAGVGVAGYFAYKYITRNDASDIDQLRLFQYGITKENEQFNNIIYNMEEVLKDTVVYDDARQKVIVPKIPERKYKALLEIFGIKGSDKEESIYEDEESREERLVNEEKKRIFDKWLYKRAIIVYANHLLALKKVNKSYTVDKVNDISNEDKYKYLTLLKNPTSIYSITELPFNGVNANEITYDFVNAYLEKLINDYKEKIKKSDNSTNEQRKKLEEEVDKKKKEAAKAAENNTAGRAYKKPDERYKGAEDGSGGGKYSKPKEKPNTQPTTPGEEGSSAKVDKDNATPTTRENSVKPLGGPLITDNVNFDGIKLANKGVNIENLHPLVKTRLGGLGAEYKLLTGKPLTVVSGYRSFNEQKRLFDTNKGKAAPPGKSLHEYGLAIDVNSSDLNEADKLGLLAKYGFTRPVRSELWHIEPTGVAAYPELAKSDPNKATELIEASAYKGGGGYALISGLKGPARDTNLQLAIFNKDYSVNSTTKPTTQAINVPKPTTTEDNNKQSPITTSAENKVNTSPVDIPVTPVAKPTTQPIDTQQSTITEDGGKEPSITSPVAYKANASPTRVPVTPVAKPTTQPIDTQQSTITENKFNTPPLKVMENREYSVDEAIKIAAQLTGVNEDLLRRIVHIESSGRPNAKSSTSSATGLFQFIDSTWKNMLKKYKGVYGIPENASPENPLYNAILGAQYAKDNLAYLRNKVGEFPIPEDTAIYLAHHYGPAGAVNILKFLKENESTPMKSIVSQQVYNANRKELAEKTVGEYIDYLNAKLGIKEEQVLSPDYTKKISRDVSGRTTKSTNKQKTSVNQDTATTTPKQDTTSATKQDTTTTNLKQDTASTNKQDTLPTTTSPTATSKQDTTVKPTIAEPKRILPEPPVSPLYRPRKVVTPITPQDLVVKIDTSAMEKLLQNQNTILEKILEAVNSINQKYTTSSSSENNQSNIGNLNNISNIQQQSSYGFKDVSKTSVDLTRMANI